jgi:hypothetical protein
VGVIRLKGNWMQIDLSYIQKLLSVFIDSEGAHINISSIKEAGIIVESNDKYDQCFLFHIQIALENKLISNIDFESNNLKTIGLDFGVTNNPFIIDKQIRLTQNGHDFAKALNNKEVLLKLKSELNDAPFKAIFDGSQKLLQHYFKKKIDSLIE